MAVAVGPRDPNAFACCPVHECKLGKLTHSFGAEVSNRQVVFLFFQVGYPVVVISGWWTEKLRDGALGGFAPTWAEKRKRRGVNPAPFLCPIFRIAN